MSPKEASYGMGDPYTVYPVGKDFCIPPEVRDGRTLDMAGIAEVLRSIFNGRSPANLKPLNDRDYIALLRSSQQDALLQYPKVAVLHWKFITQQNSVWTGLVPPTARLIIARVAKEKFGENTWMPVPSGKLDVGKDIDPTTKKFAEILDAAVYREGKEESGEGEGNLRCGAYSDEETGFLVCSGCAPTNRRYDQESIRIDSREYTEVMVPTVPALVSMMRDRPDQFTDGVVLSLLQTAEYLVRGRSEAMASLGDRLRVDPV